MKNLVIVILLCAVQSFAQNTLHISKPSSIEWQGKAAFSSYSPIGTLAIEQATLTIKNDSIIGLIVSVDMPSLSQENKQLEGHLREADFFDVTVFDKASFTLTKPIRIIDNSVILEGLMTIKGKTRQEQITATIELEDRQWIISFDHTFDRTTYGINYNSPSIFKRLKENAIDDAFTLKGQLKFNKTITER